MRDALITITLIWVLVTAGFIYIQSKRIREMQKTVTSIEKRMDAVAWVATRYKGQKDEDKLKWDKKIVELSVDNDRIWGRIGGLSHRLDKLEEVKETDGHRN